MVTALAVLVVLATPGGYSTGDADSRVAPVTTDVVVYGANAAGVIAAVAAARGGATVSLLCNSWPDCWPPNLRVGGLTAGGLGMTDSCHQNDNEQLDECQLSITGGLTKEFYNRSASRYFVNGWLPAQAECHQTPRGAECAGNYSAGPNMPYNLEPSVALEVFTEMIAEQGSKLTVHYAAQVETVDKAAGSATITSITTDDRRTFSAATFVDASYEGDLLKHAGVKYTVGRESRAQFNESWAGRRPGGDGSENEWRRAVSPYDKSTGDLLPGVLSATDAAQVTATYGADKTVMAYNFRLCVTQNASNMIPFAKPDEYHPEDWELYRRYLKTTPDAEMPSCNCARVPMGKFDMNNCGPISSDLNTAEYTNSSWRHLSSWAWPEASYATRREIWRVHQTYMKGMLWFLTTDLGVDPAIRARASSFGLCRDEFVENGGWPPAIYQREVRRMVGDRVFTQNDVEAGVKPGADIGLASLGISAHAEDSHNVQRFACPDRNTPPCYGEGPKDATGPFAWNEGDYHCVKQGSGIYQLPSFMVLPTRSQASNLLVVAAPSATHVGMSTFRMEPAFMVLGNSVGVWAAMASREQHGDVQAVSASVLHLALLKAGQVLAKPSAPPPPPRPPPGPRPRSAYSCSTFKRCIEVASCKSNCSTNATCSDVCPALGQAQWLAAKGGNGGFAIVRSGGEMQVQGLSSKSFLKKSELHSSMLPPNQTRQVPKGTTLSIWEAAPISDAGYWLVTLR